MFAVNVLVPFVLQFAVAWPLASPAASQFQVLVLISAPLFEAEFLLSGSGASIFGFIFGGFGAGGLAFAGGGGGGGGGFFVREAFCSCLAVLGLLPSFRFVVGTDCTISITTMGCSDRQVTLY